MRNFAVEQLDTVAIADDPVLAKMDMMSPFVWKEGDTYKMMVRLVPTIGAEPEISAAGVAVLPSSGNIYAAYSNDGLNFTLDSKVAIVPGKDHEDAGGCEDPTVLQTSNGQYLVYYTGVDAKHQQGCMILARGPALTQLTKQRLILKAPPGEGNIKEATLAQTPAGDWRLFYEYAANDASRIGMAGGPTPEGPWSALPDPFGIREDSWDNWHLSTGPILEIPGRNPVMFYNGATHDARWRIGWVEFDPTFTTVTDRGLEPLILPPPAQD